MTIRENIIDNNIQTEMGGKPEEIERIYLFNNQYLSSQKPYNSGKEIQENKALIQLKLQK